MTCIESNVDLTSFRRFEVKVRHGTEDFPKVHTGIPGASVTTRYVKRDFLSDFLKPTQLPTMSVAMLFPDTINTTVRNPLFQLIHDQCLITTCKRFAVVYPGNVQF